MKQKASKKITSLLLALALLVGMVALPSTALTASAANISSAESITPDNTGNTTIVYFGEHNGNPMQWRVVENDNGTMTLFNHTGLLQGDNSTLEKQAYDTTHGATHQYWSGSDICLWLNDSTTGLLSEFSVAEQGVITTYGTTETGDYETIDISQKIVLPSVAEINDTGTWGFTDRTERTLVPPNSWWLRSAGFDSSSAAVVNGDGDVLSGGFIVNFNFGIRPALKINLTSVIFSSSNPGGKPTTVGANLEAASPPGAEIKLTVLDSSLAGFTVVPTGINGNSITLNYSGVGTAANRISAVVKKNSGEITHVGMLVSAPAASGTTTVELPSGFDPANDNLYIFAETVNLANYTDYASDLVEIPVEAQAVAPTGLAGVPCTNASNNDGKITGLTTDMEYSTDSTNWTAVTGTELTGLSAGNYMVRYKEKSDSGTVYLASPTASVTIGTYTPPGTVATPTANPAGGQVTAGTTITLNVAEAGATIHYTIDSSVPTTASPVYSTPITVNSAMTIKAVAVKAGMTDSVIMNENYTIASTPPTTNHTITLGASGDGTVSGGGSYADNSTATVTATPNAGWRFKQWTENGAVVSTNGVYSFKVTAARTLTAEFEQGNTPPPTTSGGSSSGSGGGGSNKPDSRPVVGGTTTSTTRPLTKPDATKLFDTALAAKPAGATTLSIKVQNKTSVTKEVLAELAALAKKNGVTLTVHFDTVVGGKVVGRVSVNPALVTTNLDLTITENKALAARFAKFYSNPLAVFTIKTGGSVAIPLPANLKPEDLVLYSYDTATNTYLAVPNAKPWVDKNGYLHFELPAGTEVVVSQGKLVKK